ncbi:DUF2750 domain-containing protein [Paractinoplanes globisporus]|uniref:DUF2750 domain-containing protein n=1 Tax=Paractinoplanes globisporus TaxID=113565 RepID=A0ABW6WJH3_9ACTN|nr:DUF2750 domain-containing protein [Actinoplanes globisporus]
MSQSASQAAAFFRDLAVHRVVWQVEDEQGRPAPMTASGQRAMPFWSSRARAQRAANLGFWGGDLRATQVPVEVWRDTDLPDLETEGLLIGINWTGPRLVGYEFTVPEVLNRIAHALKEGPYADG